MIECLTGEVVMQGASVADILYQQLSPVDVALPPSIASQPLGSVLRHALSKHPAQRAASADELAAQFRVLNFAALVGPFDAGRASRRTRPQPFAPRSAVATAGEYRQVTTLCCCVTIAGDGRQRHAGTDHGALLDRYEAQWLTKCADIAVGYGAQVDERLGDTLLFHFGLQGDIDRPRARARAALDMVRVAGRARLPVPAEAGCTDSGEGWRVELAAAIHVGQVLAHAAQWAGGSTPAAASRLLRLAGGQILISDDARLALERHVDFRPTGLRLARAGLARSRCMNCSASVGPIRRSIRSTAAWAPMIGRTRELGALLRAWQETLARHRRVMHGVPPRLVVGDAGIGKSRLVHGLCETVRAQGHAFAHCGCQPERENHALFPILRFIGAHWQLDADSPADITHAAIDAMLAALECDRAAARVALAAGAALRCEGGEVAGRARTGRAVRCARAIDRVARQWRAGVARRRRCPVDRPLDRGFSGVPAALVARGGACIVLTSRPVRLARWVA